MTDITNDTVKKEDNVIPELTVGQILTNARTNGRRKRELSTIARQLCIKEDFLAALEAGEYDKIPELVYILGFARNYAVELGLDPADIVLKIKHELNLLPTVEEAEVDVTPAPNTTVNPLIPQKNTKPGILSTWMSKSMAFGKKHWKWFALGALVLVILVVVLILTLGGSKTVPSDNQPSEITSVSNDALPAFTRPVRESFGNDNKGSGIIVQATAETWIKIENARGETLFSRVLVPGDIYYAPNGGRATLGNAGGVDVWVNNTLAPKLGAANTRKSGIVLNPDTLLPGNTNVQ